jgi:uncharacterized membrane-anchored protein
MSRRQVVALAVGIVAMLLALGPPLWIRATGSEVTLAIEPVDPLSLFRGNYVDLRYSIEVPGGVDGLHDESVYVVFADERPARALRVSGDRPSPGEGEFCLRGRYRGGEVALAHLEQFYVTPEKGRELEENLRGYLAVVKVTDSCKSILVDIEAR